MNIDSEKLRAASEACRPKFNMDSKFINQKKPRKNPGLLSVQLY